MREALVIVAPRFVHADVPGAMKFGFNAGFEDPRAVPIRGNAPHVGSRFTDRQLLSFCAIVALFIMVSHELRYSSAQAEWWARIAQPLHFELAPGPTPEPIEADAGPYDLRLGYVHLPDRVARLRSQGFVIAEQARPSPRMRSLAAHGLDVIYPEKTQAGLELFDRSGRTLYSARYPRYGYAAFDSIPPLMVASLLFIEDRELLDGRWNRNPVVDWARLSKAMGLRLLSYAGVNDPVIGGSTLATQLEKFRHSPGGRTDSVEDKLRQMASASVRIYRDGADNRRTRLDLVTDYINSLPLAGRPEQGEIIGLGDGLRAWYGADFGLANKHLMAAETDPEGAALAYKRALSLLVAVRRPSYYLGNRAALETLTDRYLRVLAGAGVISPALRDAAIEQPLTLLGDGEQGAPAAIDFIAQKDVTLARVRLAKLLDADGLYALDRYDMSARTTIDASVQDSVTATLAGLKSPATLRKLGLIGDHLLGSGDPAKVIYSFTLYERSAHGNLIRVNTDSFDQPFDINTGTRIDLGSTAKLRTLVTYLQMIADIRARYVSMTPQQLRALRLPEKDRLSAWVVGYLIQHPGADLRPMLAAAMQRKYSASPYQTFATGGGTQRFSNFDHRDDDRVMTIEHALQNSVNLVFVRLMRELTDHLTYRAAAPQSTTPDSPPDAAGLLEDSDNPDRARYLARFADAEGRQFIRRFYRKYTGVAPEAALELALDDAGESPRRIATIVRAVRPDAPPRVLAALLAEHAHVSPAQLAERSDQRASEYVATLYDKYSADRFSLNDRGYLARVHPLELWVLAYLDVHPDASLHDVLDASTQARQNVYGWLLNGHRQRDQNRRIAQLLESDAFLEIQDRWQRLGYPFASLTPSLATALGASGDRPSALAELMGIIANDGIRYPTVLIDSMRFAAHTPYETRLARNASDGERVLLPEIAQVVRAALVNVVDHGTAIALKPSLLLNGIAHVAGGKTGTGDHRFKRFAANGRLIDSRAVDRAATFVFMIDDRFFGNITAFVPGTDAAQYRFTSSLPVRVLGLLMPQLEPLLRDEDDESRRCADGRCDLVVRR